MVALAEQSGRWEHSTNAFRQSAEDTDMVAMTLAYIKGGMKLVRNECPLLAPGGGGSSNGASATVRARRLRGSKLDADRGSNLEAD